jgi:ribonucleoside-diphosphate reductase alpha chain
MEQTTITIKQERTISLNEEMYVTKRDGKREIVSFDKILNRIKKIGQEANMKLNYTTLVMKVIDQLYDGISTTKIDELSAEQCASMASIHPDYNVLAGSIIISNHHRNTSESFVEVMTQLYNFIDKQGNKSSLISDETFDIIQKNADELESICDYSRDYLMDFFGYKTLERAYLMRINNKIVERIQHMWLRVSVGIHGDNLVRVKETYDLMSQKYFTHATPTLFNAGTPRPQLSSCFLLAMESDSIDGIYNTLKDCASISKWAGGIGLHIHNIRASGSHIRGTNGSSNGIVPMLKVFNNTAKYVDQCLDPDTIVYTKRGAIPIKRIVPGDEVVTDDGQYYEIGKVLDNHYVGDFYTLEIQDALQSLKMTDMHPLWCIQNPDNQNSYHIKNMLDKKMIDPDFIEVKNIKKNDYIGFPIPTYEKDIREYTEEDCRFYGIFLSSLTRSNAHIDSTGNDPTISLEISNTRNDAIQFIETYLNNYSIPFTKSEKDELITFEWTRINRFKFTYEMFYEGVPSLLHLPKPKLLKLIRGMLESHNFSLNDKNVVFIINSKNSNLHNHLRYMLLRLGILISGNDSTLQMSINDFNRILQIDVTCPPDKNDYFEYNSTLFSRVTNNTFIIDYEGRVIDIEVDNEFHHNFLTQNGLVKNGGGKRNGSFAIYLEPWHADVEIFLQMRKNHGDEELKARDLFYALWIPDLFMERIKADGKWTLMCPDECPGLSDVYGEAFNELYTKYEREGKGRATVKARDLWFQVLDAQMETGTPYLVYKDAANKKSNQQNVGTIKSSNLCVAPETMILTDKGYFKIEDAVDQLLNVWNGEEFSETIVRKTGEDQELIEVHLDDGSSLSCTKYHKFFIEGPAHPLRIEAYHLSVGDAIIDHTFPVLDGTDRYKSNDYLPAYTHGVLASSVGYLDYNITKYRSDEANFIPMLRIDEKKTDIIENIRYFRSIEDTEMVLGAEIIYRVLFLSSNVGDIRYIPVNDSLEYKLGWFAGLCDIDGFTDENYVIIKRGETSLALEIKYMLQTCGIDCDVEEESISTNVKIPIFHMMKLIELGLQLKNASLLNEIVEKDKLLENKMLFQKRVSKIAHNGRRSDTYCFKESKRNMGIFNGILTGQCSEIIEYSDENETAVCNLASIALPSFVDTTDPENPTIDYEKIHEVTKVITYNLNQIIDVNYYPTEKTKRSNMRHRPIGIGIQGLADVFMLMNLPFTSDEAKKINHRIFETIYHGAVEKSCEMAAEFGSYETFDGSPASKGELQFDLWKVSPTLEGEEPRYDWETLKKKVMKDGLRNSLLLAPMPTASTSQILGNNECIEPITSNIYNRRTLAGEFILANKYLMKDLIKLDLWNEKIKNNIIANNGSVQHIEVIPPEIREKYKTVWEIPMRVLIDMAADRGAFVCQSQSLNLWLEDPNYSMLTSMHFYAWSKGLKTGIYYLRRRARHQAQQFTIEPEKKDLGNHLYEEDEVCEMCSA